MFICPRCQKLILGVSEFHDHIKFTHNITHINFTKSICPYDGCNVEIFTWSGYLRHCKSHEISLQQENIQSLNNILESNSNETTNLEDPEVFENITVDTCIEVIIDSLGNFCASLMAKGVNNSVVDFVVKDMEYLVTEIIDVICRLGTQTFSNEFNPLGSQIRTLLSGFGKVRSGYQRQKLFEKRDKIISPVEISLGNRTEVNVRNNKRQQVIVEDTFMYVPLLKTLEKIIRTPELFQYFKTQNSDDKIIRNFADSESFKSNNLFSIYKNAIQLQLFYDDFETVNPLGSKKGVHKLGGIYFILRNFPDFLNSQLSQIHLLALFYSEDAKKYGFNAILNHILPDIRILEITGILIGREIFRGTICSVVFDNLGGNSLLGFTESFNSNYFCRICCISKTDCQNQFDHTKMSIRNSENYLDHLNSKTFGVQSPCELNTLKYFNFLNTPTVDIMHDLLEGVVPYEIKLVLQKLICVGCFDLETVNHRILAFDFGYLESKNKPNPIRLDGKGNKIGQKAAQTWCLIRFLPIILGDLIITDEHLRYWELILQLLKCMSIIFSRIFTETLINKLEVAISKHHNLFKTLFPNNNLIPKHHFMVHYPYVIKQSGPLLSLWTMRFEGKHNYFAQIAHNIRNFRNICLSLAVRHQQYSSRVSKNIELHFGLKTDEIFKINLSDYDDSFDIIESLNIFLCTQTLCGKNEMLSTNQIWYNGYNYKRSFIVCYEMGNVFPKFGQIYEFILYESNTCLLILKVLDTEYFDRHLFAYKIKETENIFKVVNVNNLITHDAMELKHNCNVAGNFVISRHYL